MAVTVQSSGPYNYKREEVPNYFKMGGFEKLPPEILHLIFSHLAPSDQGAATCVCWHWRQVGESEDFKTIRDFCFGKTKWMKYFGDIGVEPPLPGNIGKILSRVIASFGLGKKFERPIYLSLFQKQSTEDRFVWIVFLS